MDRCIIDGLVYTNWLHMEGKVSDTVQRTFDKAYKELVNNLDIVFYTSPVQFQDDGERSTNTKFITDIEQMFENVIWSMETCDKSPLVIHLNGEFATRFNYIKIAIEQHEHSTIG